MIIIMGLGNPGGKFKNTRHNAGFMAVDFFAKKNNFPEFKKSRKYELLISERPFDTAQDEQNILLAKPETFMNESGRAAKKLTAHYKLPTENLIVVHDDIDLPLGKIKFSKKVSSAGHKGVDSIIKSLKTNNFIRLRIGVNASDEKIKAEKIVIKKLLKEESEVLQKAIEESVKALDYLVNNGLEKTMHEFNKNGRD